eukprot:scaffold6987_cov75-Phaeocystis_antarctica.AAC.2
MARRAVLRNAASRRGAWRAPAATGVSHVLPDPAGRLLKVHLTPLRDPGCPESRSRHRLQEQALSFMIFRLDRQIDTDKP